jgi:hypothetical protein
MVPMFAFNLSTSVDLVLVGEVRSLTAHGLPAVHERQREEEDLSVREDFLCTSSANVYQ